MRTAILLPLFALVGLPLLGGCGADPAAEQAPDFEGTTLRGEPFRLSDHRGEVVILNFWATWCAPCVAEIPAFVRLQDELEGAGVRFVGVSQDADGEAAVRPFAERFRINYPLLLDSDFAISRRYGGISYLPTTFVIDREGRVVRQQVGGLSRAYLLALLDDLDLVDVAALRDAAPAAIRGTPGRAEPLPARRPVE
ncbi:MAG: TlpA disulfide reductase family protein [Rhodothermales bacterium]|nr:TlpA disulfide reductase family protein [Rhodothermales bacterium]